MKSLFSSTFKLLLAFFLFAFSGCSSSPADPTESQSFAPLTPSSTPEISFTLDDSSWRLVSYVSGKGNLSNLIPETEITLVFTDGEIRGNAGCNDYYASYKIEDGGLFIGHIGQTEKFCSSPEKIMDQESAYLDTLTQAKNFIISNQRLHLLDDQGRTTIIYVPLS